MTGKSDAAWTRGVQREPFGWAGTVASFLQEPDEVLVSSLEVHLLRLLHLPASGSQIAAWRDEVRVLRSTLRGISVHNAAVLAWGIVFEYELHLEGGRRPDVVLLAGDRVFVLEFKEKAQFGIADVDQAAAYARDLAEYHAASHGKSVEALLIPTKSDVPATSVDGVRVLSPAELALFLATVSTTASTDVAGWVHADYAPIPSLVEAARLIFTQQELPRIRRCWSSGVPEAVAYLGSVVDRCSGDASQALAFLAGVPGAGKTLAGLQLVYERSQGVAPAVFLSGNGPLVEVLRGALDSKTFVRDLHAFISTYGQSTRVPDTKVIVFDEAQRAWDSEYMEHKKGITASEPDLLIQIAERVPDWSVLVGLVGDGQEIHAGEEAGIGQWARAVEAEATKQWTIHCPPRMAEEFDGLRVVADARLDLTVSLRSKRADSLHEWVRSLLEGRLAAAARLAQQVRASAFPLYVTRDLEDAKAYVRGRYQDDREARYGLLASSRTQTFLPKYGVESSWPATKRVKYSQWYNNGPGEPGSGCNFDDVVTEFGCQGLELDMPVVAWGNDVVWHGSGWAIKPVRSRHPLHDAEQLRLNAYRVLLTRGRDGLVVFVPPAASLDATETALLAAGLQPLPADLALVI